MAKAKRRKLAKPVLKVRRFENQQDAEEYAEKTTEALGERDYRILRRKGRTGVNLLLGVKRPAVLVVTPTGKVPKLRITPKRPRISR